MTTPEVVQPDEVDPDLAVGLEPSVIEAIRSWQRETESRVHLEEWLTTGHTSASVAVVVITGAQPPSRVILKACPPERLTSREPRLHAQALARSPGAFAERHLVQQPFETIESTDKWRLLFQSIAGDSLRRIRPLLSVLDDDRLPRLAATICRSLLREWNPEFRSEEVHPQKLLFKELGSKVDRNGPLVRFLADHGFDSDDWTRFSADPTLVVPNAIRWSLHRELWPEMALWVHKGHVHGDLHSGNVLIRIDPAPDAENYRLIDLSGYDEDGSLARDPTHFALSIIGEHLSDTPSRRRDLLAIALGDDDPVTLDLYGLRSTLTEIRNVANEWQSSSMSGMGDAWDDQSDLALVAEALEFVGRRSLPMQKRMWFMQLACIALGRYFGRHRVSAPPADPGVVRILGRVLDRDVESAVEKLLEACEHFSGSRIVIGILAPDLPLEAVERAGDCPWTAMMAFDPNVDVTGALALAKASGKRAHRLVSLGQAATFAHGATTWFALGGLTDLAETTVFKNLRTWRRNYKRTLEEGLAALARSSPRPVTAVVFGEADERVRAVVEAIDDRFPDRAQIVVAGAGLGALTEFSDVQLDVDAGRVLAALPCEDVTPMQEAAVPGHDGPVILPPEEDEWVRERADLVDLSRGTTAEGIDEVGQGFLRGRLISWFELSLGLDILPRVADGLLDQIRQDLTARDTRRVSLLHFPGAGGSTLSRRVAWEMHRLVPTLYCSTTHDEQGLAERIAVLSQRTGLPVLVVLEQTTDLSADRLYNRLRGDSVPAVLLVVSRRLARPPAPGQRSFYLGPAATAAEVAELAQRYGEYAPHRLDAFADIRPDTANAVPFYFGLVAFEEEYAGLGDYVRHSAANVSARERDILLVIALSHRYAGISVAGDLFAEMLDVSADRVVHLDRALGESSRSMLVEEEPGFWRTTHWLVAGEVIRQLLSAAGTADPEAWRLSLSSLAVRAIEEARSVFGLQPPDDVKDVLERLFIVRENRELLGEARPRSFSELLEDIPSLNGRLEVLRRLAEAFADEAHYWAHYGRLLSYEGGDVAAALAAVNRALELDEHDSVLFHIRGMVYSRQLRDLGGRSRVQVDVEEVLRVVELALADFAEAARLSDASEYPYVAAVQVAVAAIEAVYGRSGCASHAEFFTRPASAPFRALLEQAEAAVDAIGELSGGDPASSRAQEATVSLASLYDDYSTLLQGWRNLLDRPDVLKTPIRRRLVRTYVRRAGDWNSLGGDDRSRVLALLEENLQDDPTDSASLRDWLRVARRETVSLDRAAELVSYWALQTPTRDSLYYDYVLSVLQVVDGRESLWQEAKRKIERCQERSATFGNRRFSYEWLGRGSGLGMLLHHSELPENWEMNAPDDLPGALIRQPARVARIGSPQAGTLRIEAGGLDAFFVPARAGVLRGRHENARVDAVLGFSYDGLRAWSVRVLGQGDT